MSHTIARPPDRSRLFQAPSPGRLLIRIVGSAALAPGLLSGGQAQTADESAWAVAGRQGIIRIVIVPVAQARDRDAYARQVARLCEAGQTCFLNFFTNSKAVPVDVPLPDAIASEATAIYRHSMKQGAELFRWSCRLATGEGDCF